MLGRHVDGLVDSYNGPAEIAAEVDAEPLADPGRSPRRPRSCLASSTTAGCATRSRPAHVCGVHGGGAGLDTPTRSRAATACGRPHRRGGVRGRHEELEPLLPGDGPLGRALRALASVDGCAERADRGHGRGADRGGARVDTTLVELPDGEAVGLEIVRDRPWLAFCEYMGGLRSRISINVDIPISALRARAPRRLTRRTPATTPSGRARTSCWCAAAASSRRRSCWCPRRSRSYRRASPNSRRSCSSVATVASG